MVRRGASLLRRHLRVIVGLLVTAVSLYYVLRIVEPARLWETFRQGNYLYIIPALVVLALVSWARAIRWRILFPPERDITVKRLFGIVNIGYLFNNVLPAKAGEVVRAYLVGRIVSGGIGQSASTLLIERLMDVLSVAVLLLVLLPFVALPAWVTRGGILFGGAALGGTAALIVLSRYGERGLDFVWRFAGRLPLVGHPKVWGMLSSLLAGFRVLTVGRLLAGVAFWSGAIWLGYWTLNYIFMATFRLDLPPVAAAVVLCATGFSMVVPSSPGAIGPFQYAAVLALSVFGLDESTASAYAFGLQGFTNITLIVFGLIGLRSEGVTFSGMRERVATEQPVELEEA
jgi:glycosyltransferase 2 family protein